MVDRAIRKSRLLGAPSSRGVLASWGGRHTQHRYEDFVLIQDVLRSICPLIAVELGTGPGGFTCLLADTLASWDGCVVTVDHEDQCGEIDRPNVERIIVDCLVEPRRSILTYLTGPRVFLYCDNGDKTREITLYAPHLGPDGLLGTHDYDTEVDPAFIEPFLTGLGFCPERHGEFEALANADDYPYSLTRMWRRL